MQPAKPQPSHAFSDTRQYMSGIQALVELPMLQRQRDLTAGLHTAGFISGYRGSPLGTYDQALWKADQRLLAQDVRFQPGINEELAATAVWGTQQVNLFPRARYDGVFALWYGKGPGADRSLDAFKHGNAAGSSRHGGVLLVVGDDHGAKSSSLPHQSDHLFSAAMIPVLNPSGVQEFLDYGLHGWAMSRFSGCWVGLKAIADTVETSASVLLDPHRIQTIIPQDFTAPADGLNIRWPDQPLAQELRLQRYKVYAAMAYARANGLNRIVLDSPQPRLGIITTGKSYLDVRQALESLGIGEAQAQQIGLRVFKIGMAWPLDWQAVRHFAEGLEEILVVEEKRQLIEYQLKEQLYNWREDVRPRVIGKYDETGEWQVPLRDWLLPAAGELTPAMIARVIAARIARFYTSDRITERLAFLDRKEEFLAGPRSGMQRVPHYCSGCPHNSSTKVPDGSRALAGIGCHYMATWLHADTTQTFSQMGGEGVPWVGQAPFTDTPHVFANLGDGTYAHSGLLAIRQAVAAKVSMTYKILFNDAVAMTGGQKVEGGLTVAQIVRQVAAENVLRIVVVTDDPGKYPKGTLPPDVAVHERHALDKVQRDLRAYKGLSVLVYDQTCAAEKRRRRKRKTYPDPAKRVMINDRVCEGCGDCSATSNCMSVVPLDTEYGRKREIDQSSCNKDYTCTDGFCPSFVTIEGGRLRQGKALEPVGGLGAAGGATSTGGPMMAPSAPLPTPVDDSGWNIAEPCLPPLDTPYGILIAGVGGTGIVTIGALLGTAAMLEGKGATALDMAGLAQKGGPVWSHIRLAPRQDQLFASRIAAGEANLVIGCDIVVAVADESLVKMRAGFTHAVINRDFSITSDFVRTFAAQARTGDVARMPDPVFPEPAMEAEIADAVGADRLACVAATRIATALLGDSIATNLFMVGFAYQNGLIPISSASILQAIEINGAAVAMNKRAFLWGRRMAVDPHAVEQAAKPPENLAPSRKLSADLDEMIQRRAQDLTAYQNAAYAKRYTDLVTTIRAREAGILPGDTSLTEAVARYYYKLLAYKDEYEVARLYTETKFLNRVAAAFEGDYKIIFHLAPPLWAKPDKNTGLLRKKRYGPWMLNALRVLAKLRILRGTMLDPFRHTEDRSLDRKLILEYETSLREALPLLTAQTHAVITELAALPDAIRGYGHIRKRHVAHVDARRIALLRQLHGGGDAGMPHDGGVGDAGEHVVMAG